MSIRVFIFFVLILPVVPVTAQNCDVDFPGTSVKTFSATCGGPSAANLTLGQNTPMGSGDIFTFDAPAVININGNLEVNAEGSAKMVIPAGVTVNVDGNFKLDDKNSGCSNSNPCTFEIEVYGTIIISGNLQNKLANIVWSGTGTVIVDNNLDNDGCMRCNLTECPAFDVLASKCKDNQGCAGDFCVIILNPACQTDVIKPVITGCPSNINVSLTEPGCTRDASWTAPSATDNCQLASLTSTHRPGSLFSKGTTTVTYTATDAAGNTATCSFNVTVVDDTAPVIANCPANITVNANASCQAVVSWTAPTSTDNCAGGTLTTTRTPGSTFPKGTTAVTYTATDEAGNTATCSFNVTVVDDTAPVIANCPANISVNAEASSTAQVSWTAPTFTDNCAGGTITSSKSPGSVFPEGITTVVYTATDAAGNSSTCSFDVAVIAAAVPVITGCPQNITVNASANCNSEVNWSAPTATGSAVTMTSSHSPGDIFSIGTTTVTYVATDDHGNISTCQFNVNVSCNLPPVISDCPEDIHLDADENGIAIVHWSPPSASAACGSVALTSSREPGEFLAGTSVVEYKAVDEFGNASTCTFNVIVSQPEIVISRLVTPDGDGVNDYWELSNLELYSDNRVIIVDRWGGVIFEGAGYDNATIVWRGTNRNGALVPTGTYFYNLVANTGSKKIEKSGFIELIR